MSDWYWLSWADERGFRGGANVPGADLIEAVQNSFTMGISPGSDTQVAGIPIPDDKLPPAKWRGWLMSRDDIEDMDVEHESDAA